MRNATCTPGGADAGVVLALRALGSTKTSHVGPVPWPNDFWCLDNTFLPLATIPVLGLFYGFVQYLGEASQHVAEFCVLFLYKPGCLCDCCQSVVVKFSVFPKPGPCMGITTCFLQGELPGVGEIALCAFPWGGEVGLTPIPPSPSVVSLVAGSSVEQGERHNLHQLQAQRGRSEHDNIPSEGDYSQHATATAQILAPQTLLFLPRLLGEFV